MTRFLNAARPRAAALAVAVLGAAVLGVAVLAATACGPAHTKPAAPGPDSAPATQPPATQPPATQPAPPAAPGKPQAPVNIEHTLGGTPAAGQNLTIELRLTPRVDADNIDVELSTTDDLRLLAPDPELGFAGSWPAGRTETISVLVVPETSGQHYLHVVVALDAGGLRQARAVAIPVTVGTVALGPLPTRPDGLGGHIVPLPAVETSNDAPAGN